MLANILIWLALIIIAGLFAWLARRALRLRNPAARWALVALAALPALLFALVAGAPAEFKQVLDKYYAGKPDPRTLELAKT